MNTYTILISNYFGKVKVCEWGAESAEDAIKEFTEMNPEYKKNGVVLAELKN